MVSGSSDCSIGWTTLTSLPLGFIVPITPSASSTTNVVDVANTRPVRIINSAAGAQQQAPREPPSPRPVNIVSTAEPSSMPVTITPMRVALYPSWSPRYAGERRGDQSIGEAAQAARRYQSTSVGGDHCPSLHRSPSTKQLRLEAADPHRVLTLQTRLPSGGDGEMAAIESTVIVSPSTALPSRISRAAGSLISRWITRFNGLAPNDGS